MQARLCCGVLRAADSAVDLAVGDGQPLLERLGFLRDALALRLAARLHGGDGRCGAGRFGAAVVEVAFACWSRC